MKTRKTIVLAVCLLLVGLASAQLEEEWVAEYDRELLVGNDVAKAIAVDGSGYVYVTGYSHDNGSYNYVTIKYDPSTGETLWVRLLDAVGAGNTPSAIAVDASGNVYVTGGSSAYATVKYNTAGVQQWVQAYYCDRACPTAIVVDGSGSVYVTGASNGGPGSGDDYTTIKYASDGTQLWFARYDGPCHFFDRATAIAVDAEGNAYVTGSSTSANGLPDYATIKYNASDGGEAWVRRYDGPVNSEDQATAIAVDASGSAYVTGYSLSNPYHPYHLYDYATIKYEPDGDIAWNQYAGGAARYNGPANWDDKAWAIAVDASGNAYVTGGSQTSGTSGDYATIKYEPDGDIAWTQYTGGAARYHGPADVGDAACAIAVDASGNAYVTGSSRGSVTGGDYATVKYEPDGDIAWTQYTGGAARYNGPANGDDRVYAVAVDASGNAYVTGFSYAGELPGSTNYDYATIKYDGTGSQAWVARYTTVRHTDDRGKKVAFDASGNVFVLGQTDRDYVTIKYDRSTGETLWVRYYHARGYCLATALAVDAAGDVCVTGYDNYDYTTIKYEPDGDIAWTQYTDGAARYNGPFKRYDYATAIAVDLEGNVYVTGSAQSAYDNPDYATVKYNSAGVQQWVACYNGPANSFDYATAIAVDDDGNVCVTGYSASQATSPYNYDYATVKYNASDGGEAWVRRYLGPANGDDRASAIAVDASGNILVTGFSNAFTCDYATIKYEPDGDVAWTQYTGGAARYNGGSSDYASAVAVDAEGSAYVAGYSYGPQWPDYATIKYESDGDIAWDVPSPPPNVVGGAARYNGPANRNDRALAIALNSVGACVTGWSEGSSSGPDYATVMYDRATGAQLDCKRYTGPGANTDQALSIATGPAGAVAVTGQSRVPVLNELVENNNIVTIKYSTGTADVGVAEILEPSGLIDTLSETPVVTVQNYGTRKVSFTVWFEIKDPASVVRYLESVTVTDLEGETPLTVNTFPVWDVPNDLEGQYTCRSWTVLSGDIDPSNDQATSTFGVEASPQSPSQWTRQTDVPEGLQRRVVQHGSCAATDPEGRYLYLLKGDNTCEFYRYDPATMTWTTLEPIPEYGRDNVSRTVKEGGTLAQIGGKFYATKGGNSTEFWVYDPAATPSSRWTQMADVTDGTHSGASACGVSILSEGYIYLLRASATFDFYRYSVTDNAWEVMANAPGPDTEAFKLGSSITCNGMGTIYALKGIYNRFYSYSVATNTWSPLADLPLGAKNKQAKGGAAICYHLGKVYCLKGSNSQEFWIYDCNANSWVQDADVPLGDDKTRVQDGGTLVYCSLSRYLFATKGGTLELWSYGKLTNYEGPMGAASVTTPVRFSLAVSPSVTNSRARIAYGIPKAGNVSLKLYDVTGRSAATFRNGWLEPGRYTADVEAGTLARGIYILKLEADSRNLTRKLVIE